jgi:acetyl esterase/lipase
MSVGKALLVGFGLLLAEVGDWVLAEEPAIAEKPSETSLSRDEFFALKPSQRFEFVKDVPYASPGGEELLLDVYVPKLAGPLPAVMVVHGGAWRSGSKGQLSKYARDLAARGMVTFAINYRLSPKHKFPAQLEDCQSAVKWVRKHAGDYKVDPKRIGAIGYSAGGHLVALMGVLGKHGDPNHPETDTTLSVVCAGGAPCDFRDVNPDDWGLSFWLGGSPSQVPKQYLEASPMAFISKAAPPMLFYNGTADVLVKYQQAKAMSMALKAAGVETQFVPLEGMGHILAAIHPPTLEKAYDFLVSHLHAKTPGTHADSSGKIGQGD